jgi:hypothetical protein
MAVQGEVGSCLLRLPQHFAVLHRPGPRCTPHLHGQRLGVLLRGPGSQLSIHLRSRRVHISIWVQTQDLLLLLSALIT